MQSIKTIINDLDMVGHELGDGKIVILTLNSLTNNYKELKTV